MARCKSKRRWLQFSLRSVLLLTLAVALWLGYEVRQARHVERAIAALRALGGDVECEPTGWSLLRLCRVPGYGQRIVRAEIPGAAVEEAVALLGDLPHLREVHVTYDGTYDPTPSWKVIRESLITPAIVPKPPEDELPFDDASLTDDQRWEQSSLAQRMTRLRARVVEAYPKHSQTVGGWFSDSMPYWLETRYQPLLLPDGTLAELLISEDGPLSIPGSQDCFVVLVIADTCVGAKFFTTSTRAAHQRVVLEDFDGDGFPEVGFHARSGLWGSDERVRQLPGDSRNWLGVYKITRDGFKSLLPEDRSDFP